jgi:hypothetical protein
MGGGVSVDSNGNIIPDEKKKEEAKSVEDDE